MILYTENDHPKREEAILAVARYFNLTKAESYPELERDIKRLYQYYSYTELVRPLINYNRTKNEMSLNQLAVRYGLTKRQVQHMLKK